MFENLNSIYWRFAMNQKEIEGKIGNFWMVSRNFFLHIYLFCQYVQVILFEIDCAISYTDLHELFCQLISWTNWVNSGKLIDYCWISCHVMADMKKVYNDLIIINLY